PDLWPVPVWPSIGRPDQHPINARSRVDKEPDCGPAEGLAGRRKRLSSACEAHVMDKVLVIDDNELDRKIAFDVLTHDGFAVELAGDGHTGLRKVYECRPDLVLLDVMMPALDGWSVCQRVR